MEIAVTAQGMNSLAQASVDGQPHRLHSGRQYKTDSPYLTVVDVTKVENGYLAAVLNIGGEDAGQVLGLLLAKGDTIRFVPEQAN